MLFIVLCSKTIAQSTSFINSPSDSLSIPSEHRAASPFMPSGAQGLVHGMGVYPLSSYFPDSSYKKAYKLAIEDLRANLLTSVYLEQFSTTRTARNREFGILDEIDLNIVAKLDSTVHNGYVYFYSSVDSLLSSNANTAPSLPPRSQWMDNTFSPMLNGQFWLAAAKEEFSPYAPNESWARSKLNALSRLSRHLYTKVQSSISHLNSSSSEITYISSKTIFRDIRVVDRFMRDGYCHTLLAVKRDNIRHLE